jgi:hypothetical protein
LLISVGDVGAVVLEVGDAVLVPIRAAGLGIGHRRPEETAQQSPRERADGCSRSAVRVVDRDPGGGPEERAHRYAVPEPGHRTAQGKQ